MNKKQKECRDRGFHSFSDKDGKFDMDCLDIQDDAHEITITITCKDCGASAECQGDFWDIER
jgi:predicted nucleic-acid-binding Zn-ribbon protein